MVVHNFVLCFTRKIYFYYVNSKSPLMNMTAYEWLSCTLTMTYELFVKEVTFSKTHVQYTCFIPWVVIGISCVRITSRYLVHKMLQHSMNLLTRWRLYLTQYYIRKI